MRSVRLAIYPDGAFVVTAPKWYPGYVINRFIADKAEWLYGKLKNVDFQALADRKKAENLGYKTRKETARQAIGERVEFFNRHYHFPHGRIAVKNQRSCWGSCSRKGNLNFNWKIIDLPEELRDYVVVHELCHLQELNHGPKFWQLVAETFPDYRQLRRKLRQRQNKL